MEQECVVLGCRNSSTSLRTRKADCGFFNFPLNQTDLICTWLRTLNLEGWTPGPENVVCEEHFTIDSFDVIDDERILKSGAVPTMVDVWNQFFVTSDDTVKEEHIELDETDLTGDDLRCRICAKFLSSKNAVDIYSKDENVIEKIMACIPILVETGDNLPGHICRLCLRDLNTSYQMLIRALESKKLFHYLLNKMQGNSNMESVPDETDVKKVISKAPTVCMLCNAQFGETIDLNTHFREKHAHEFDFTYHADGADQMDVVDQFQDDLFRLLGSKNEFESKPATDYDRRGPELNDETDEVPDPEPNNMCVGPDRLLQYEDFHPSTADTVVTSKPTKSNKPDRSSDATVKYLHCQYCDRPFQSEDAFNKHMENHIESAMCELCGFVCADYKKMLQHRHVHRKHSPSRTNTCPVCCTVFLTHVEMMRHSRQVHRLQEVKNNAPPQKWICRYCGKEIGTKLSLTIHERVHTGARPFVCEQCGRSFRSKANLIQHQPVHTGVKRYKCSICDKAFARKAFVSTHMRVHTGERPYTCDVCGNKYTQIGDMRRHKKRHYLAADSSDEYGGQQLISIVRSGDDGRVISIRRRANEADDDVLADLDPANRLRLVGSRKAEADEWIGSLNNGRIKVHFAQDTTDFRRILVELQQ